MTTAIPGHPYDQLTVLVDVDRITGTIDIDFADSYTHSWCLNADGTFDDDVPPDLNEHGYGPSGALLIDQLVGTSEPMPVRLRRLADYMEANPA